LGTFILILGVILIFLGLYVAFNFEENNVSYFIIGTIMWGFGAFFLLKYYRDGTKEKMD